MRWRICVVLLLAGCSAADGDSPPWPHAVIDAGTRFGPEIAIAQHDGKLHVAYVDDELAQLRYARETDAGWVLDTLVTLDLPPLWPSMVVDEAGVAHFAYFDPVAQDVRYRVEGRSEIVDARGDVGRSATLGVTSDGVPRVFYRAASPPSLRVSSRGADGWTAQTIANASSEHLGITRDGSRVFWSGAETFFTAVRGAAGWTSAVFEPLAVSDLSVADDVIAYAHDGAVSIAERGADDSWSIERTALSGVLSVAVASTAAGARLAFIDTEGLRYAPAPGRAPERVTESAEAMAIVADAQRVRVVYSAGDELRVAEAYR